jgi:hypothetical protein
MDLEGTFHFSAYSFIDSSLVLDFVFVCYTYTYKLRLFVIQEQKIFPIIGPRTKSGMTWMALIVVLAF